MANSFDKQGDKHKAEFKKKGGHIDEVAIRERDTPDEAEEINLDTEGNSTHPSLLHKKKNKS